ncbi:MAG: hypothetical protein K0S39_5429 [Paenibacillus sp.]|jgi:hypothetical protein|nr:hypothetical protein [Paenibacillus sp.]
MKLQVDGVFYQPHILFEEINRTIEEFTGWVKKINKTNSLTPFDSGMSIVDALAERDKLMQKRNHVGLTISAGPCLMPLLISPVL